jgi:hypothetical protein
MGKPWYTSKTIWVNALALGGSVAIAQGIAPDQWAEISTAIITVANIVLRLFFTDQPIN